MVEERDEEWDLNPLKRALNCLGLYPGFTDIRCHDGVYGLAGFGGELAQTFD